VFVQKEGEARLTALKLAPQTDMGIASQLVSRLQVQRLGQPTIDAVLGASASVLPAFVGVKVAGGYVVAKIEKVVGRDPIAADAERARSQYSQAWVDAEAQAYVGSLKNRLKVQVTAQTAAALATK
jgi:peptidyl-prolyl cis-trans isomerase D